MDVRVVVIDPKLFSTSLAIIAMFAFAGCKDGGSGDDGADEAETGDADTTGGESTTGGGNCGAAVCGANEHCIFDADPPYCECDTGYTGSECEQCAPGYEDPNDTGTCRPIMVDCDEVGVCGLHGSCISMPPSPDYCQCEPGYTGPTCAQCGPGLQDNDQDGTCEPDCDSVELDCEAPLECVDDSGTAICDCPGNTNGDACQYCDSGFKRIGDGPCYQVCPLDCVEPGQCFDDGGLQPAECRCPSGHAGVACDTCESGWTMGDDERCHLDVVPASHTLLTHRLDPASGRYFTVVDPDTGDWQDLGPMPNGNVGAKMAWDPETGSVYTRNGSTVSSFDIAAGTQVEVVTGTPELAGIVFDPDRGTLLGATNNSPYDVWEWDPSGQGTTSLPIAMGGGDYSLAVAAAANHVWGMTPTSMGATLYDIDLAGGTRTEVGKIGDLEPGWSAFGFSIDPVNARAYLQASRGQSTEEIIELRCRIAADRMGFDHEGAPATVNYLHDGTPAGGFLLESTSTGPEIVIYRSYDNDADPSNGYLRVAVDNPQAFICIFTYEEILEIHLEPGATWAGGVVYSYEMQLTASADGSWNETPSPMMVHYGAPADDSFANLPAAFRILDGQEWGDRVFPSFTGFYDYNEDPTYVLQHIDIADRSVVKEVPYDAALEFNNFMPWRP